MYKCPFIGWIPCLSGELFFSKTDHGLGSFDFFLANGVFRSSEEVFESRKLVASSVVDWQDSNYISKPNSGLFRVVLMAESASYKSLSGKLFLIEKNGLNKPEHRNRRRQRIGGGLLTRVSHWIGLLNAYLSNTRDIGLWWITKWFPSRNCDKESELIKHLIELSLIPGRTGKIVDERLKEEFTRRYERVEDLLFNIEESKVHLCEFYIHQCGVVYLRRGYVGNDFRETDFATQTSLNQERSLCRQSFYYLKYLFHKHSHHADENESLTTVHRAKDRAIDNAEILIRDIKRGIVDAKRSRKFLNYEAAGIASYGASLVASCESLGWFSETCMNDSPVNLPTNHKKTSQLKFLTNIAESTRLLSRSESGKTGALNLLRENYMKRLTPVLAVFGPMLIYLNIFSNGVKSDELFSQLEKLNAFCGQNGPCRAIASSIEKYAQGDLRGLLQVLFLVLLVPLLLAPISRQWKRVGLISTGSKSIRDLVSLRAGYLSKKGGRFSFSGSIYFVVAVLVMWVKRIFLTVYQPSASFIRTIALYGGVVATYGFSFYLIFIFGLPKILGP